VLLIFSRYARYTSPSLAGTTQFTSQDRKMISIESFVRIRRPVPWSRVAQRSPRSGNPA
jgi:hypothetical protein